MKHTLLLSFLTNYESYTLCRGISKNNIFGKLTREQVHLALIHKTLTVDDLRLDVTQRLGSPPVQGFQISQLLQ